MRLFRFKYIKWNNSTSCCQYSRNIMDAEVVDICLDDLDERPSSRGGSKSVNFGVGAEMLMNDKKRGGGGGGGVSSDVRLDDLNDLERELNDLTTNDNPSSSSRGGGSSGGGFSFSNLFSSKDSGSVKSDDGGSAVGASSRFEQKADETWDGYSKFNEIPVAPDTKFQKEQPKSREELLREKFKVLRQLEDLEKRGVQLTRKYTMESNLSEMKGEYETIMDEKRRQNGVKFAGGALVTLLNGLEFLNDKFDPFDVKLDGWSKSVNMQVMKGDLDEVLGEIYEKYKGKGDKLAPELRLAFTLITSAVTVGFTNSMMKASLPGMEDIMRNNPEIAQQFMNAAVNTMGQRNPSMGGFMSNIMNAGSTQIPQGNKYIPDDPPSSADPRYQNLKYSPPQNVNYNTRPDLDMARQPKFMDAEDMANVYATVNDGGKSMRKPASNPRPEMRGPSDIDDILSSIKTKNVNIGPTQSQRQSQQPQQSQRPQSNDNMYVNDMDDKGSTISIGELKEIQGEIDQPKKSRRRKSDKNIVSLDL